ncbi:MAG: polyprenyl synthetase family protein [Firmicutes bacterium]|nr:polyprenyl synthetase family protein [Bacillota bacterium]
MKSPEYLRLKELVDTHILDYLPRIDPNSKTLYEAMKYSLTAGGKRIRPVLFLYTLQFCGHTNVKFGLPYACAIEYIQTYSLIHDDLPAMDNDDFRRGIPTNHKVFGEAMAILAGDGLLSAAYEVMSKDMLNYLDDPEKLKKAVRCQYMIAKGTGCRGMVAGQVADVENEHKQCSAEMLDYIHDNKTAAFIRASILAGGYLGGADENRMEALRTYGDCLGLAFQIMDDIQDVIGNAQELGKTPGKDLRDEKNTYTSVHGLENAQKRTAELIARARDAMAPFYDEAEVFNDILDYIEAKIHE